MLNQLPYYDFDLTDAYGPNAERLRRFAKVSAFPLGDFVGGGTRKDLMGYQETGESVGIGMDLVRPILSADHVVAWCPTAVIPKFALKFEGGIQVAKAMQLVACVSVEHAEPDKADKIDKWVVFEPVSNSWGALDPAAFSVL